MDDGKARLRTMMGSPIMLSIAKGYSSRVEGRKEGMKSVVMICVRICVCNPSKMWEEGTILLVHLKDAQM